MPIWFATVLLLPTHFLGEYIILIEAEMWFVFTHFCVGLLMMMMDLSVVDICVRISFLCSVLRLHVFAGEHNQSALIIIYEYEMICGSFFYRQSDWDVKEPKEIRFVFTEAAKRTRKHLDAKPKYSDYRCNFIILIWFCLAPNIQYLPKKIKIYNIAFSLQYALRYYLKRSLAAELYSIWPIFRLCAKGNQRHNSGTLIQSPCGQNNSNQWESSTWNAKLQQQLRIHNSFI